MTLPTGQISMSQVNTELGVPSTSTISLNQANVRALAGIPSGTISMNNLRGKSSVYPRTKGYWGGGLLVPGPILVNTSHIDGLLFTTETNTNPAATLGDGARVQGAGTSSSSKGYFCGGGGDPSPVGIYKSFIDGIIFSTATAFNPAATLSDGMRGVFSGVYSQSKGYLSGGTLNGSPFYNSVIDGILFSNDTAFNPAATMADGARSGSGGASSATKGYFAGGSVPPTNVVYSFIDGILFSNDTAFNPATTLSDGARTWLDGVSSTTKGYFCFGATAIGKGGSSTSNIDGILFSNDTAFNPAAGGTDASLFINSKGASGDNKGYLAGGGSATGYNSIHSVIYSNDTAAFLSGILSQSIGACVGGVSGT